jgi:lipid A ethanolaminephosphotransferase
LFFNIINNISQHKLIKHHTNKNSFLSKKEKFKVIGSDAVINEVKKQKTIGIFIVGETARADRFSLNGYKKLTNRINKVS